MIVPRKICIHSVSLADWHQIIYHGLSTRSVTSSAIRWGVSDHDLPVSRGSFQRFVEPLQLKVRVVLARNESSGVDNEEVDCGIAFDHLKVVPEDRSCSTANDIF